MQLFVKFLFVLDGRSRVSKLNCLFLSSARATGQSRTALFLLSS
jgi:hypothetical protein